MQERPDNEILFSKTVKAGKRIYYIDVKRDRRDEYYLSVTESKRVREATETERPVFEKHKIFLYREDMGKFASALAEVMAYVERESGEPLYRELGYPEAAADHRDGAAEEGSNLLSDLEF